MFGAAQDFGIVVEEFRKKSVFFLVKSIVTKIYAQSKPPFRLRSFALCKLETDGRNASLYLFLYLEILHFVCASRHTIYLDSDSASGVH